MSAFTHTPYDGAATPFTLGMAPCPPEDWIETDDLLAPQLAEKDRYLSEDRDAVYRTTPGMAAAETEVLALLLAHLPERFPDLYSADGEAIAMAPLGRTFTIADYDAAPLTLAGRLVQEDLCLIRPLGDGRHELGAACLCFPSSWRLADKIGKPLEGVHAPVPGFQEDLAARVNRLFERLPDGQILQRWNWSLDEGAALHRPQPHSHDRWLEAGDSPASHVHIRTERQTIRKLPASGCALFTIRIGLDPLAGLETHPRAAALIAGLHDQLAAMSDAQAAYKGLTRARPVILEWLSERLGS